jgi:uncharacterized protein (DUF39 family)
MKLTKERLKTIIKEELKKVVESVGQQASEENQDLVVVAKDAIVAASNALLDLQYAVEDEGFKFNRDSPVTLADLDYKMSVLNQFWSGLKGAQ